MPICKICKSKYVKKWEKQPTCLENAGACAIAFTKIHNEKQRQLAERKRAKEWAKEKSEIKQRHMKFSDWLKLLQIQVNTFVRLRDKDLPCISCNSWLGKKYHAGHFYSVGSHPNLRFDEENIHGQCEQCNIHFNGNVHGYRFYLIGRIGIERFEALEARSEKELKISIPDIKIKIAYYKKMIKDLKNA